MIGIKKDANKTCSVNMYASTWLMTKTGTIDLPTPAATPDGLPMVISTTRGGDGGLGKGEADGFGDGDDGKDGEGHGAGDATGLTPLALPAPAL